MQKQPCFNAYVGGMFAMKTSYLLNDAERLKFQHKQFIAFKPQVDLRYDDTDIVTHLGAHLCAIPVSSGTDLMAKLVDADANYDHIFVDELFMIPGGGEALIWLFRKGISIYVSSLDLSYEGKPFKEITAVLPWATKIVKCTAVCTICGDDARYTHRKSDDDVEILIGGSEKYDPRCMNCHPFIKKTSE